MDRTNTKNQHFVPRTYLRFFSSIKGEKHYINVFDKTTDKYFNTNIKNVASQTNFYEIKGMEKNYWENYYNNIESTIPIVFGGIISASNLLGNRSKIINNYYKNEMCKIIHSQLLRTNSSRIYFDELGKNIANKVLDKILLYNSEVLTSDHISIMEKYRNNFDFIHMVELDSFNSTRFQNKTKAYLKDRTWVLYKNINYKTHPFITSDNPVFYINVDNRKVGFGDNGIARKDTIIGFSISPELLLVLYPKYSWYLFIQKLSDNLIYFDDIKFVEEINDYQLKQCNKQIYSINKLL